MSIGVYITDMMTGRDLERVRERLGRMSRKDLAKLLDVHERTVIRWECAPKIPRTVERAVKQIESELQSA